MSIGKKIVELRKKNNMTQAKLGEKLNISAQAVSKWERDLAEPDLNSIKTMAKIFNISVDDIFENKVHKQNDNNVTEKSNNENKNNINNFYVINNVSENNENNSNQKKVGDSLDEILFSKLENVSCENCGSGDVEQVSEDFAICKQCGSKIHISRPATKKVINNNFYQKNTEGYDYLAITKMRTIEDFRRESLITLASDVRIPPNIFDSKFGKIKSVYTQYVEVEADLFANYSATIGYDRQEEYIKPYNSYYDITMQARLLSFGIERICTNTWLREKRDDGTCILDHAAQVQWFMPNENEIKV